MPPLRDAVGTYYLAVNRNKRSIVLDLNLAANTRTAHDISARADVFIHNCSPYEPPATPEGDLIIAAAKDGQFRALTAALLGRR